MTGVTRPSAAVVLAVLLATSGTAYVAALPALDVGGPARDGPAAAQETPTTIGTLAQGETQFELVSATTNVPVDGRGTLALTFENTGDAVRNASVRVQSPNESLRFGPAQNATDFVGTWARGERRTVRFELLAEEFAETRSYPFEATVAYTATNGTRVRTPPFTFDVRPSGRIRLDRFEVTRIASTVQAGETGTISVTVENTGPDVDDAIVTLRPLTDTIRLGRVRAGGTRGVVGARNATRFVGDWASNEDVTFEFDASAGNDTVVASYPFSMTVSYATNGNRTQTQLETFGVIPAPEQSFALGDVTSTLRVGDEGNVTGAVVNEGPEPVRDATLVLQRGSTTLRSGETQYPLGTIPAGERRSFRFDVDASNATSAGPRQLTFRVVYRSEEGGRTASDPLPATIQVGARREPFDVTPVDASFGVDESGRIRARIANDAGRPLRNVTARLQVAEPLTSDDPSAYVGRLAPGGSATAAFELTVEDEAVPGRQPATVLVTYETPDGERRVAGPYQVPVQVQGSQGPGFPLVATVAVVAVVLAGAGWWWWRGR
ncbi:COG1361 S-layer family protein [Halomicrococcus gelatinilyticus]|uniref:COG1361 S-layer family protein n=1 Tax=Halomicrococcus gelatinilyticus TaxID=1702103 RepID=UPI002E0E3C87